MASRRSCVVPRDSAAIAAGCGPAVDARVAQATKGDYRYARWVAQYVGDPTYSQEVLHGVSAPAFLGAHPGRRRGHRGLWIDGRRVSRHELRRRRGRFALELGLILGRSVE